VDDITQMDENKIQEMLDKLQGIWSEHGNRSNTQGVRAEDDRAIEGLGNEFGATKLPNGKIEKGPFGGTEVRIRFNSK
jgi:hypothetical protein